jgi:hypothetical protein
MKRVGRTITGLTLIVGLAATAVPADARSWRHHRGGGDDAAIAIGAGIIGLGIGAAIASDHNDRGRYYSSYDYDPYYGSYYAPAYGGYYGYRSYRPRYYGAYYGGRDYYRGCYTRRVYDPYIGHRVRVRYCR